MRDNNIVNIRTGLIVIESVSYCTNNGLYSYNLLTYTFTATGKVKVQVKAQVPLDHIYIYIYIIVFHDAAIPWSTRI